jgi:hypothetical protein
MRVKLTAGRVGNDFYEEPGQVVDVPAAEAQRMIDRGQAMPHDQQQRSIEAAAVEPPRNAALPHARKR